MENNDTTIDPYTAVIRHIAKLHKSKLKTDRTAWVGSQQFGFTCKTCRRFILGHPCPEKHCWACPHYVPRLNNLNAKRVLMWLLVGHL